MYFTIYPTQNEIDWLIDDILSLDAFKNDGFNNNVIEYFVETCFDNIAYPAKLKDLQRITSNEHLDISTNDLNRILDTGGEYINDAYKRAVKGKPEYNDIDLAINIEVDNKAIKNALSRIKVSNPESLFELVLMAFDEDEVKTYEEVVDSLSSTLEFDGDFEDVDDTDKLAKNAVDAVFKLIKQEVDKITK